MGSWADAAFDLIELSGSPSSTEGDISNWHYQ
jgi:hypothetical protein